MSTPGNTIRLLVAEDHSIVREGLVGMVEQQPDLHVVAETGKGSDVVPLWQTTRPDVTLLDLQMGDLSGIEIIGSIRSLDPSARILVLTTYDFEEDIYRSIQAGACGYLLKDVSRLELLEAIRRVHRGEKALPPAVASKLAERMHREVLTARETEVIQQVAQGRANKEIADLLQISEGTVKVHLRSVFEKLGVLSRTEAIKVARERGLLRH